MRPNLAAAVLLCSAVLSGGGAAAQAPTPFHLPWDVSAAEGAARLEAAGFRRRSGDDSRYVQSPGGGFRRVAGDPSVSTYTRSAGGVSESVLLRAGDGAPAHLFYSAVGDSAALQAKLDAVAGDAAARLGAPAGERGLRVWRPGGEARLTVPSRPTRLPDHRSQFVVLFYRAAQPAR